MAKLAEIEHDIHLRYVRVHGPDATVVDVIEWVSELKDFFAGLPKEAVDWPGIGDESARLLAMVLRARRN